MANYEPKTESTVKYIALDSANKPIDNGKFRTIKQWVSYGNKRNTMKKYGFQCVISIVSTWISLRDYEYVRINYGHL